MGHDYIYIVLSKTGTWLSRSIGAVTRSNYTHVSLSLDNKFDTMYTFGRKKPTNPFYAGLTIEDINNEIYQNPYCTCLIYKIPVSRKQLQLLKKELNSYLNSSSQYKYNFLGLFAVLFNIPVKRDKYYFCSQFVSTLLSRSTIWYSPKVPELTRPSDLIQISNGQILYKGFVNNFTYNMNLNTSIL